jgi:flagellar L-ring protein FlgH
MKTPILFLLFFLTSCASYINSLHRQIDHEDRRNTPRIQEPTNRFGDYRPDDRFRPERDKRPIKNPVTFSLGGASSGRVSPPVKREYRPQRYQADDFIDNDNNGSLWASQGSGASLFTYQANKQAGDMVIINVLENLKNQISVELKRAFPDKSSKTTAGAGGENKTGENQSSSANSSQDNDMDVKVYDKISSSIAREVNKDYVLIRGRKEVIFKKEKRFIEVQGLVSRKDIMEDDYVNSDKMLESKVFVLERE